MANASLESDDLIRSLLQRRQEKQVPNLDEIGGDVLKFIKKG